MHKLFEILKDGTERSLGEFEEFYTAIETADNLTEIKTFKLCDVKDQCIYGARRNSEMIYWRRQIYNKARGRDKRFFHIFNKFTKLLHK